MNSFIEMHISDGEFIREHRFKEWKLFEKNFELLGRHTIQDPTLPPHIIKNCYYYLNSNENFYQLSDIISKRAANDISRYDYNDISYYNRPNFGLMDWQYYSYNEPYNDKFMIGAVFLSFTLFYVFKN